MTSFEIYDPRTGQVLSTIEETPLEGIAQVAHAARGAAGSWRALTVHERVGYLRRVSRGFYQRRAELLERAARETGKPEVEVLSAEVLAILDLIAYFCRVAPEVLASESIRINPISYPHKHGWIVREPMGIVAVVSSWNYPIALAMRAIVPALLAGNCVLFKPSKEAALTGACLGEVLSEQLPSGVFATCQGGRQVTAAVVREADRLQFVGSSATGTALAHQCAEQMIPAGFELSGIDRPLPVGAGGVRERSSSPCRPAAPGTCP